MKPFELFKSLDPIKAMSKLDIVLHSAWSRPIIVEGEEYTLRAAEGSTEGVNLSVSWGQEKGVLTLFDSPKFPDFSRLFPRRAEIPDAIMLAVIEKEAGVLLQALENAIRAELSISGLIEKSGEVKKFEVVSEKGEVVFTFALTLTETILNEFARLEYLDLSHESIASMKLPAEIEFAAFPFEELEGLEVGDSLLLPELDTPNPGIAVLKGQATSEQVRVLSPEESQVTFAQVVIGGDAVRRERSEEMKLILKGEEIGRGVVAKVGSAPALRITAFNRGL